MLGLETESVAVPVCTTGFPRDTPIQEIARVELQPRFRGVNIQHAPRGRLGDAGGVNETELLSVVAK